LPTVTATASPAAICNGATSVLTASGANTYSWSGGLGSGASKTVTPSATTTYTVTGTSTAGCSGTATVSVTVNPLPTVTATASPAAICNGSTSVLTASGANTYSWNTGGSTASITVTPSVTTIYTVTGTTNEGCTGTASVTVNVSNPPIIDYTTTQSHCGHSDGNIMTNVTGGIPPYIYQWSNGAISPNLNNISSGSYILTVNDNNGCSSSISITVTEAPKPQANFAPKPQITTIDDPIIYFENYSIDASSYEWDFGDGYNSSEFSPIHTYQNAGEYHILLSAIDQYGCIDTAGANVIIQEFNTYYVPNAFTPNRNELNESFNIFGSGINPNTFEMRIFDRWGKEIFFTKDINQGWDGTFKGEIVPAGIYTYIIKFEDSQGYRKNVITGKVILAK
jgi:gliding motility-associated-like protein